MQEFLYLMDTDHNADHLWCGAAQSTSYLTGFVFTFVILLLYFCCVDELSTWQGKKELNGKDCFSLKCLIFKPKRTFSNRGLGQVKLITSLWTLPLFDLSNASHFWYGLLCFSHFSSHSECTTNHPTPLSKYNVKSLLIYSLALCK